MTIQYKTKGVCSQRIDVTVDNSIIKKVEFVGGCAGNPQGVAFLFKNDPRKLTLENPMPFYQYPLQVEKLETIILCEARTAGVIVYYPLSALIAVGVS